jgi:hypothetical protein
MNTVISANDYHCSITANISAGEAFENISDVAGWWTSDLQGSAKNLHDIFTVTFGDTFVTFEITEVIPDEKITWYVRDCNLHWIKDKKEWKGTSIVWAISSENGSGSTVIDMTHYGLIPGVECYGNCESGWNHFIKESLFKLLTERRGLPEGGKR